MQLLECVSFNDINVTPMTFIASSDVLPWNPADNDPFLDGNNDMDSVQVLCINTLKLTSDQLVVYNELTIATILLSKILSPSMSKMFTLMTMLY